MAKMSSEIENWKVHLNETKLVMILRAAGGKDRAGL
jgi:hypothetical protein